MGGTRLPDPNPYIALEGISLQTVSKVQSVSGNWLNRHPWWKPEQFGASTLASCKDTPQATAVNEGVADAHVFLTAKQHLLQEHCGNCSPEPRYSILVTQAANSYQSSVSFTFPEFCLHKDWCLHLQQSQKVLQNALKESLGHLEEPPGPGKPY